jgi:hypothetical protein
MSGMGYDDWGTLLKTWLAANYANAPTGPYGYKSDSVLKAIKGRTVSPVTSIDLFPGEGVYSKTIFNSPLPIDGKNIKYAGLILENPWLDNSATYPDGALLTYNANFNNEGSKESGMTTGISANVNIAFQGRSVENLLPKPFAISAGDMLRLNGQKGNPILDLKNLNFSFSDLTKFRK